MALDGYCLNLDLPQLRRMAYAADMEDLRQRLDELIEIGRQILSRLADL